MRRLSNVPKATQPIREEAVIRTKQSDSRDCALVSPCKLQNHLVQIIWIQNLEQHVSTWARIALSLQIILGRTESLPYGTVLPQRGMSSFTHILPCSLSVPAPCWLSRLLFFLQVLSSEQLSILVEFFFCYVFCRLLLISWKAIDFFLLNS